MFQIGLLQGINQPSAVGRGPCSDTLERGNTVFFSGCPPFGPSRVRTRCEPPPLVARGELTPRRPYSPSAFRGRGDSPARHLASSGRPDDQKHVPEVDTTTPAVVLKFDPNVMHHGGLASSAAWAGWACRCTACTRDRWAPAASSRYLRAASSGSPTPRTRSGCWRGCCGWPSRIGRPAVLFADGRRGRDLPGRARGRLRRCSCSRTRPRTCPGGWPASTRCTSCAASWACPPRRPRWPGRPRRPASSPRPAGFPLIAKLTTPWRGQRPAAQHHDRADASRSSDAYGACARPGRA